MKKVINKSLILDTAQKRFGRYGVKKTSMSEIADDMGISKASLYYYFPDKESLYKAVVEKEQDEFIKRVTERMLIISDPEQKLIEYVSIRLTYFRSLLNLSRLRLGEYSSIRPAFRESLEIFRKKEQGIIGGIFQEGIVAGVFSIDDPEKTAFLFLDLLKGLRIALLNEMNIMFIEDEEFRQLLENTLSCASIFINGLKNREKK